MNKKLLFFQTILSITLYLSFPLISSASPLHKTPAISLNDQLTNWTQGVNSFAPTMSVIINSIFTIMFLFGVARLGYSIVTKTGHVMKGSSGLLIWVPITYFFMRVIIILLFTINEKNITLFASDVIQLLISIIHLTVDWMLLFGLAFYLFYKLINHPEYGRWSKRLWLFGGGLTIATIFMPMILGG